MLLLGVVVVVVLLLHCCCYCCYYHHCFCSFTGWLLDSDCIVYIREPVASDHKTVKINVEPLLVFL